MNSEATSAKQTNVIYIDQPAAAAMTTYKELVKMYQSKDPVKYSEAIAKNKARYRSGMDEIMEQSNVQH